MNIQSALVAWGVSLTFRELYKMFSRNLCIAQMIFLMRISSWNFVHVPIAMLRFGQTYKVPLEIFTINVISCIVYLSEIILESFSIGASVATGGL